MQRGYRAVLEYYICSEGGLRTAKSSENMDVLNNLWMIKEGMSKPMTCVLSNPVQISQDAQFLDIVGQDRNIIYHLSNGVDYVEGLGLYVAEMALQTKEEKCSQCNQLGGDAWGNASVFFAKLDDCRCHSIMAQYTIGRIIHVAGENPITGGENIPFKIDIGSRLLTFGEQLHKLNPDRRFERPPLRAGPNELPEVYAGKYEIKPKYMRMQLRVVIILICPRVVYHVTLILVMPTALTKTRDAPDRIITIRSPDQQRVLTIKRPFLGATPEDISEYDALKYAEAAKIVTTFCNRGDQDVTHVEVNKKAIALLSAVDGMSRKARLYFLGSKG